MIKGHSLAEATGELWLVDLDCCAPALEEIEAKLSQNAATPIEPAQQQERRRRRTANTALLIILGRLARSKVRDEDIVRDSHGRPYLPGNDLLFSLSHTHGFAVIGVAGASAIGVDLEHSRKVHLSAHRRAQIISAGAALSEEDRAGFEARESSFLRAWVRIEAFAKARGDGLAHTLTALGAWHAPVSVDATEIAARTRHLLRENDLEVKDLVVPAGMYAAVAVTRGSALSALKTFPADRARIQELSRHLF